MMRAEVKGEFVQYNSMLRIVDIESPKNEALDRVTKDNFFLCLPCRIVTVGQFL
jgi:hypothetical protein